MSTKALRVDKDGHFLCPSCMFQVCRHADTRNKARYVCHACELDWPVLD